MSTLTAPPQRRQSRGAAIVRVLDVDGELAGALTGERLLEARARLVAHEHRIPPGPWTPRQTRPERDDQLGLLVLEGLLAREVVMGDNISAELIGEGDLIRPWQDHDTSDLLRSEVRWTAVEPTRLAVLGSGFSEVLTRYPEIHSVLLHRLTERSHRLALAQAISTLNGVDQRILALLWHLASRWGRVTPQGITLRLALPHRVIAQLVGARRPTVSTAITRLVRSGDVVRLPDRTWLLSGDPVGRPSEQAGRVIRMRRPPGLAAGSSRQ
jgi:CRP/FNR family cyclic AMP-dependent transcriptional regulator